MKRSGVLALMALAIALVQVPRASAEGWTRCGDSVIVSEIGCPAARRFAHEYLDDYYYTAPTPKRSPGGFDCTSEMLKVGPFDHLSCARIRDGVHQRVRFFFRGHRIGGPRGYWRPCGIRSRVHGPSCAEARQVGREFLQKYRQDGKPERDIGAYLYYCSVRRAGVRYGPIYCFATVGSAHQSTFTEWKILLSFEELERH